MRHGVRPLAVRKVQRHPPAGRSSGCAVQETTHERDAGRGCEGDFGSAREARGDDAHRCGAGGCRGVRLAGGAAAAARACLHHRRDYPRQHRRGRDRDGDGQSRAQRDRRLRGFGIIQSIDCDYNTIVRLGQVCARIDPRPYQAVVDQDIAAVAVARAQLAKDAAGLDYARRNASRLAALAPRQYASRNAADSAKAAMRQGEAQTTLDRAVIAQDEARLSAARANLGYTDIVSPVNGIVVSRNVTIGQTVAASFQTPTLFLIATDLTRMQVDTNVSEGDIAGVRPGETAQFTVLAFPGKMFEGRVTQVRQSPQTVQNVVTYDVVIAIDNRDLALKPGMTASVRIITASRENVLLAPGQALRFAPAGATGGTGAGARVWVMRDGRPVAVPVKTGLAGDNQTEIAGGGLRVGDAVIIGERLKRVGAPWVPRF
ncbi:unnamed protein product [Acidocella sp. C78]|uniref:efflux RND transporter periplasmic adaptor subunit n=1 Tax=Acidocella sp. C78 TaxID=1671486 RepID=UPI001BC33966|nr:efflux RND transporter periplasmic adaptor subunit [Acidocella sp. C78]CAG4918551.1 unnamed protein product [Acidocella sp. C78]